jgi:hypothetical protein
MAVRVVTSLSAGSVTAGARSYKWWAARLAAFVFLISIIGVGVKFYPGIRLCYVSDDRH